MENKTGLMAVETETKQATLYRPVNGPKDEWYLTEMGAREAGMKKQCPECKGAMERWQSRCDSCFRQEQFRKEREMFEAAPYWDGSYPVFVGETFFDDEESLLDYLLDPGNEIDLENVRDLHACTKIFPRDTLKLHSLVAEVGDSMHEDADCPEEIVELIKEFLGKLDKLEKPISYIGNKLVKLSPEQIERFRQGHKVEVMQ